MLGDTAVAVHPNDERYKHLIGKMVTIPLVNREIPIIADGLLVDPTLGTGCVKVTPAHDPQRLRLRPAPQAADDQHPQSRRHDQRQRRPISRAWTATRPARTWPRTWRSLGLFEGREDRDIPLQFSDRTKTPIEPYLSDQWFVEMGDRPTVSPDWPVDHGRRQRWPREVLPGALRQDLSRLARRKTRLVHQPATVVGPSHSDLVRPLSRSGAESGIRRPQRRDLAARRRERPVAGLRAGSRLAGRCSGAEITKLEQDPDVLDTWFSSALWPHSTLGWPEPRNAGRIWSGPGYYPTSVLVTSRDIITLWVARMVLTGLYNVGTGAVPPRLHPSEDSRRLRRTACRKTKGNGVDPLDIIERYGTDALRFGMVHLATETQDSRMPVANVCPHCETLVPVKQEHMYMRTRKVTCPKCKKPFRPGGPWPADDPELQTAKQASERFEVGRNFANKLWNAARFLLLNLEGYTPGAIRLERAADRGSLDSQPAGDDHGGGDGAVWRTTISAKRPRHDLRLHLVGVLRLVRRDEQGPAQATTRAGRWCSACWSACSTASCAWCSRSCRSWRSRSGRRSARRPSSAACPRPIRPWRAS